MELGSRECKRRRDRAGASDRVQRRAHRRNPLMGDARPWSGVRSGNDLHGRGQRDLAGREEGHLGNLGVGQENAAYRSLLFHIKPSSFCNVDLSNPTTI